MDPEAPCGAVVIDGEDQPPIEADHDISSASPKRGRQKNLSTVVRNQVVDIDHAIKELTAARGEMSEVPEGLTRGKRRAAMMEPMARLSLVVRFCNEVMRSNGWSVDEVVL